MTKRFFFWPIIILFLFGCKKSNPVVNQPKTYLISSIAYIDSSYNTPVVYYDRFSYDALGRVIVFESTSTSSSFRYTYDNNSKLITMNAYDGNTLAYTDHYTYIGDTVKVSDEVYSFVLNSQSQVTQIVSMDGTKQHVSYDDKGNIISLDECCGVLRTYTFTYDSMKNPLSAAIGQNFHLKFFAKPDMPFKNANNVLTEPLLQSSYTYAYNTDGYSVTATIRYAPNNAVRYLKFEYIIK